MRAVDQTPHYERVRRFMKAIPSQSTPDGPTIPDEKTRILRARLMLEETLETIRDGLAVEVSILKSADLKPGEEMVFDDLHFTVSEVREPDLVQIADGCADVQVVTTGTLVSCGIADVPLLGTVDQNNLDKIATGTISPEGKLIKSPSHQPPDIAGVIEYLRGRIDEPGPGAGVIGRTDPAQTGTQTPPIRSASR